MKPAIEVARRAAIVTALTGAVVSIGLVLYTGRRNPSWVLMALFAIWVASPFAAFAWAGIRSKIWPPFRRGALYTAIALVAPATLAIYGYIAFGPPRPKTAAPFLIVPPASLIIAGILNGLAVAISGRSPRDTKAV